MRLLKIIIPALFLSFLCITFFSCENSVVTTVGDPVNYNIRASDYSDNHFFIDTLYKTAFRRIFTEGNASYSDKNAVDATNLQVWVQTEVSNPKKRFGVMDIDLNTSSLQNLATDTARYTALDSQNIAHRRVGVYVKKMDASEYSINLDAGFISLKTNLHDLYNLGVTYQLRNDPTKKVGLNDIAAGPNNTLILKLVKLQSLSPLDTLAWAQKMKNVYRIPVAPINPESFTLKVYYIDPLSNTESMTLPSSRNLLQVFKLDRFTGNDFSRIAPDNVFDFREGYTVLSNTGDIIFPSLEPFKTDISAVTADSLYSFPDIYELPKITAQQSPRDNLYSIKGYSQGTGGGY